MCCPYPVWAAGIVAEEEADSHQIALVEEKSAHIPVEKFVAFPRSSCFVVHVVRLARRFPEMVGLFVDLQNPYSFLCMHRYCIGMVCSHQSIRLSAPIVTKMTRAPCARQYPTCEIYSCFTNSRDFLELHALSSNEGSSTIPIICLWVNHSMQQDHDEMEWSEPKVLFRMPDSIPMIVCNKESPGPYHRSERKRTRGDECVPLFLALTG